MKTRKHAVIVLMSITLAVALSLTPAATLWADLPRASVPPPSTLQRVTATMMGMPLQFEANHGQVDAQVKFLARGKGYTLFLTPTESVMILQQREATTDNETFTVTDPTALPKQAPSKQAVVRMKLEGANPSPAIDGMEPLPGIVNYFIGNDPEKWRTKIPTFSKVQYQDAYPGIALAYYGNQGRLEYDFLVAPGADPNQIKLTFEGASDITVANSGDLVLSTALGEVRMQKPIVYQVERTGHKTLVAGQYVVQAESMARSTSRTVNYSVGFQLASYDHAKPLIIDPVLSWATYLGGSDYDDGLAIAVDAVGSAYVTGQTFTEGSGFPGTTGSLIQSTLGGGNDAFVTKLNATGTALVYSTYLGGSGTDLGNGIAVDLAGNAYVAGVTTSTNFPLATAIQSTFGGANDAFVTKLNAAGTALVYSTYLGGNSADPGYGIAVDTAGNAYVTGQTGSSNFPGTATSLIQSTLNGDNDAFVAKFNAAGTALIYSTYLGGSRGEQGNGIAVDTVGNAYVTGQTGSSNFPGTATSLIQSAYGGDADAFVTKLNAAGTALVYSTYLGGSGQDTVIGIAVDLAGNAYVTGETNTLGSGFPGTATSLLQSTFGGANDAFVTKLNADGSALVYSTYLGGNNGDYGRGIAVDLAGNAYVTGYTGGSFPGTTGSLIQSTLGGGIDAFVAKLNATGTALIYATYLGGSGFDYGSGIAVDTLGNAYATGHTNTPGTGFPGTAGSLIQSTNGGDYDAFVAKITTNVPFAAFKAKVEIDLRHRPHHDELNLSHRRHGDEFEVKATLTLGPSTNGIDPLTQAVTLQVGTFSTTIPAGSFTLNKGRFKFEGVINGVKLEAVLRPLILGNDYEFKVEGKGADLTGTENPVTVGLTIGDDSGSKPIRAEFE